MDEDNSFDLANYADLMDENYIPKEACKSAFFLEFVPEGEPSSSSDKPAGTEAVETPLSPLSNSEGEYVTTPVSIGEASVNDANTVVFDDDLADDIMLRL